MAMRVAKAHAGVSANALTGFGRDRPAIRQRGALGRPRGSGTGGGLAHFPTESVLEPRHPAHPELVEELFLVFGRQCARCEEQRQRFDKLSMDGVGDGRVCGLTRRSGLHVLFPCAFAFVFRGECHLHRHRLAFRPLPVNRHGHLIGIGV